jgi:hypothetical protein
LLEATSTIVIGVDVHKHSLTAVAVDEALRALEERTRAHGESSLLAGARPRGSMKPSSN